MESHSGTYGRSWSAHDAAGRKRQEKCPLGRYGPCTVMGMVTSPLRRVCPQCSSQNLKFMEHGSGMTVFQCEDCARVTVQRSVEELAPVKAESTRSSCFHPGSREAGSARAVPEGMFVLRDTNGIGGRCWNRTSDPRRVKAMLYR